jgi:two-component system, OmpR family, alkaline phosphatase synthesis response regulator PhoP
MRSYRILVTDREEELCEIIRFTLESEGYAVEVVYSAEDALFKNISEYNLLLIGVILGDISGFRMARLIRSNPKTAIIPIIFISETNDENDRLTAFSVGADDYMIKPFSLREMVARIKVIINRIEDKKLITFQQLSYNKLIIDLARKQVLLDQKEIQFTKKEFEILKLLMENKNRLFSREELLQKIWSEESFVLSRTIDVNITRIRKKIGPYEKNIVTKLGLGYCFEE